MDLLAMLRLNTQAYHQALHQHPVLVSCQDNTLDEKRYIHMLKAFYQPWKKLVPGIENLQVPGLQPLLEDRYHALKKDLKCLNKYRCKSNTM